MYIFTVEELKDILNDFDDKDHVVYEQDNGDSLHDLYVDVIDTGDRKEIRLCKRNY